jgi:phosphopantothenoylcysteine decarboxylase/phosphopantothenate--cysteine ligase
MERKILQVRFQNKYILLGITGSIAVYKSAYLLRLLTKQEGADVTVAMTKSAQKFMSPIIFETFSKKPVITDMFSGDYTATRHIDLAVDSDAILIYPATANIIAKAANGIADDFLSTLILAAGSKTVFAPAMNVNMYKNQITQNNISKLRELGCSIIEPGEGLLACGEFGKGKLADEEFAIEFLDKKLNGNNLLKDKKVLVTAGPTREYIDYIRFISNKSTGKMGFALAAEAVKEDGNVILVTGPTYLKNPMGCETIRVETADEMEKSVIEKAKDADFLFMSAAVEDLRPQKRRSDKIKKSEGVKEISIENSPDIITSFRNINSSACVVGFSVELNNGKEQSIRKMKNKKMDFVAWNNPLKDSVGFESDTNEITLISSNGKEWFFKKDSKRKIAEKIIYTVVEYFKS